MKQVKLPSGEVLHFAPGTHDTRIDEVVKKRLRPEKVEKPFEAVVEKAVETLAEEIVALRETVEKLSEKLAKQKPPVLALDGLNAALEKAADRVVAALTRPKRVIMKDGKVAGVE